MRTPSRKRPSRPRSIPASEPLTLDDLDHHRLVWQDLTPAERLDRSWRMRRLLPDPQRTHDEKLWPSV